MAEKKVEISESKLQELLAANEAFQEAEAKKHEQALKDKRNRVGDSILLTKAIAAGLTVTDEEVDEKLGKSDPAYGKRFKKRA
jgi:hypothetical protein